ncbi:lysophosphatidylserine lipase ABHD12-like isoform X1 [Engraulis encrasicolus]|uniref:lysophosphatidylserine lipase ABHD12-like isoform X1 n=1 Tax=Engraulis encrasicolus TaxID=184585 RepID=UPI002FCE6A11
MQPNKMRKRSGRGQKASKVVSATSHDVSTERQPSWFGRCARIFAKLVGALCVFYYFMVPVAVRLYPGVLSHPSLSYVAPYLTDVSRPLDFALNHTINFRLSPEKGISLGVWLTVQDSLSQEAQGKDLEWYQQTIGNGAPVFIYLHGNTGNRGAKHRVGVVNVLSAAGFHVLAADYRGFGDSTGEPTEAGLTTDAVHLYQWVKAHSGNSLVIMWGHSLGTGVSTNTAVKLQELGTPLDAVILEGAFSRVPKAQAGMQHPFAWFYFRFPYFEYFFLDPMSKNKLTFPSAENVRKMRTPLLILHSEDDHLCPPFMAQELYEIARSSVDSEEHVKLVLFEGVHGYLHNGLYRDARLPGILKEFVSSINA